MTDERVVLTGADLSVEDVGLRFCLDQVGALPKEGFHPDALLAPGTGAEGFEDPLEPLDVLAGLPKVPGERLLQGAGTGRPDHSRERGHNLPFSAPQILELFDPECLEGNELHRFHAFLK